MEVEDWKELVLSIFCYLLTFTLHIDLFSVSTVYTVVCSFVRRNRCLLSEFHTGRRTWIRDIFSLPLLFKVHDFI
ncbi:hypothetical protein K439DRAFT_217310 [Ramaria rubella]|nr:hypothetical protein K439DRAFT_217310 [Ramaria rubella]